MGTYTKPPGFSAMGVIWALPCSVLGGLFGIFVLMLGGTARRADHTIEVAFSREQARVPGWVLRSPILAITFGHVLLGQSHEALTVLRAHERVHVRQYERWGALFLVAYPAASLVAWLRGQCPYRGNRFEREAFALAPCQQK